MSTNLIPVPLRPYATFYAKLLNGPVTTHCRPLDLLVSLMAYSNLHLGDGSPLAREKSIQVGTLDYVETSKLRVTLNYLCDNMASDILPDPSTEALLTQYERLKSLLSKNLIVYDLLFITLLTCGDTRIEEALRHTPLKLREYVEQWLIWLMGSFINIQVSCGTPADVIDCGLEISTFLSRCKIIDAFWSVFDQTSFSARLCYYTILQAANICPMNDNPQLPNTTLLDAILLGAHFYRFSDGIDGSLLKRKPIPEVTDALKTLLGIQP